jgi:hypothetical protein
MRVPDQLPELSKGSDKMKRLLLIALGALSLTVHAASPNEFTAEERKVMASMRETMISVCRNGVEEQLRKKLKEEQETLNKVPSVGSWLTGLLGDAEYCTCSMDKTLAKMTPKMFRHGTQAEGEAIGRQAGAECLLPRMQATFSGFCNGMLREMVKNESLDVTPEATTNVCACVQKDVDAITPDTLELVMKATAADGQALKDKKAPNIRASKSLIGSMARCGIGDLGRK